MVLDHLAIEGTPPNRLDNIVNRIRIEQSKDKCFDVDCIFDEPIDLAYFLIG